MPHSRSNECWGLPMSFSENFFTFKKYEHTFLESTQCFAVVKDFKCV